MSARCEICGAPVTVIEPLPGRLGTCARVYDASEIGRLTAERDAAIRRAEEAVRLLSDLKDLSDRVIRERDQWQKIAINSDGLLMEVFDCCEPDKVRRAARLMNESIDLTRRELAECREALAKVERAAKRRATDLTERGDEQIKCASAGNLIWQIADVAAALRAGKGKGEGEG